MIDNGSQPVSRRSSNEPAARPNENENFLENATLIHLVAA